MYISQIRQHSKRGFIIRYRNFLAKNRLGKCGDGVFIGNNVDFLRFPKSIFLDNDIIIKEGAKICACNRDAIIEIGKNTTIGYYTFIFASSEIRIGDDCLIGSFVYIIDSAHGMKKSEKINQQPNQTGPVLIGKDVMIGSSVTILKDVTIGDGAVIGARSLVNTDIEPYKIYAGVPARIIGERT
jgi:acetyltransferase-like isoleucine patch superfamily enzyme